MGIDKGMDHRGIWRAIYTSIWNDPGFRKLTPNEKLVFLCLRTNPDSNIPILYPLYLEAVECQTGVRRDRISRAMRVLVEANWIAFEDGIVWVKKGLRFDPNIALSNEKHLTAVKNIILSLPKLQIVRDFIDFYKIPIPYPIPSRIAYPIPYANQDTDTDTEKIKDTEKEKDEEYEEKEKPKVKTLSLSFKKEEESQKPKPRKTIWEDEALTDEEKAKRCADQEANKTTLKLQAEKLRRQGVT